MSIEKEDTIILTIQKSAHAHKGELNAMLDEVSELETRLDEIRRKMVRKAEQYREALDYLTTHHPEGAEDWFKHMGADRETLLALEAYNNEG